MENQMTEDGSLRSVPQVESPILTGGLTYDGNGELPEPQSSDEIIAAATGSEVGVYSSGTLVKQGTILTGETIASGANNSMYVSSGKNGSLFDQGTAGVDSNFGACGCGNDLV